MHTCTIWLLKSGTVCPDLGGVKGVVFEQCCDEWGGDTCKVVQGHVWVTVVSNTDHHCIKNVLLPLPFAVLRLHVPLTRMGEVSSLLHLKHCSLRSPEREKQ